MTLSLTKPLYKQLLELKERCTVYYEHCHWELKKNALIKVKPCFGVTNIIVSVLLLHVVNWLIYLRYKVTACIEHEGIWPPPPPTLYICNLLKYAPRKEQNKIHQNLSNNVQYIRQRNIKTGFDSFFKVRGCMGGWRGGGGGKCWRKEDPELNSRYIFKGEFSGDLFRLFPTCAYKTQPFSDSYVCIKKIYICFDCLLFTMCLFCPGVWRFQEK